MNPMDFLSYIKGWSAIKAIVLACVLCLLFGVKRGAEGYWTAQALERARTVIERGTPIPPDEPMLRAIAVAGHVFEERELPGSLTRHAREARSRMLQGCSLAGLATLVLCLVAGSRLARGTGSRSSGRKLAERAPSRSKESTASDRWPS